MSTARITRSLAGSLCVLGFCLTTVAWSNDAAVATPHIYKVLSENENVRILQATYPPGETENWHGHPPYFIYAVDSGTIKVESENGEAKTYELKSGMSAPSPHVGKHRGTNMGTAPLRLLIIEFKQK